MRGAINILSLLLLLSLTVTTNAVTLKFGADGIVCTWDATDKVGFMTNNGVQMRFAIQQIEDNEHCATALSPGWSLKENVTYYAYAPFNNTYSINENTAMALPFHFYYQKQKGNDNTEHLANKMFCTGNINVGALATEAIVNLRPLTSVLRISDRLHMEAVIKEVILSVSDYHIPMTGKMNLINDCFEPEGYSRSITLDVEDVSLTADEELVVYLTLPACNLSNDEMTLTFVCADGTRIERNFDGLEILPGNTYCIGTKTASYSGRDYYPTIPGTRQTPMVIINDIPIGGSMIPTTIHPAPSVTKEAPIYDLTGRVANSSYKGIRIKNGKKIFGN